MSEIFAISHFASPVGSADIEQSLSRCGGCFDTHRVQWRNLWLAANGSRALCHLTAPDAEAARHALRRAGLPITRLWSARHLAGREPPSRVTVVIEEQLRTPATPADLGPWPHLWLPPLTRHQSYLALDGLQLLTLAEVTGPEAGFCPQVAPALARLWRCSEIVTCSKQI